MLSSMTTTPPTLRATSSVLPRPAAGPYWRLFAIAAVVYVLDALTTIWVLPHASGVREVNPIARLALSGGPALAVLLKTAVLAEVAGVAVVFRRLDAAWAGKLVFAAMAAVGSWGVTSAVTVAMALAR